MKKRIVKIVCIALAMVSCFVIGLSASGQLQKITAYLNYGVKIKYDGQEQSMFDANGVRVYPITYNGTTYVPVRAVANLFDENVEWDGANNSVLLGNTGRVYDFCELYKPYSNSVMRYETYTRTLGNKKLTSYLYGYSGSSSRKSMFVTYDVEGKYKEISFVPYSGSDCILNIYGDNGQQFASINVNGKALIKECTVPINNTHELKFEYVTATGEAWFYWETYIYDIKIK